MHRGVHAVFLFRFCMCGYIWYFLNCLFVTILVLHYYHLNFWGFLVYYLVVHFCSIWAVYPCILFFLLLLFLFIVFLCLYILVFCMLLYCIGTFLVLCWYLCIFGHFSFSNFVFGLCFCTLLYVSILVVFHIFACIVFVLHGVTLYCCIVVLLCAII